MKAARHIMLYSAMLLVARVYAADPEPAAEPVVAETIVAEEPVAADWRDPFWPVGYKPREAKTTAAVKDPATGQSATPVQPPPGTVDWKVAFKQVRIKGTTGYTDRETGKRKYQALVNGRFLVEGDKFDVVHDYQVYTFEVGHVTDKNVEINKVSVRPQ